MKLPDIEYGGKPESAVPAMAAADQERRQSIQVIQQGLETFNKELVRTQAQAASAELTAGLSAAEEDIAAHPYTSTAQVREALGSDFDRLSPEVRKQLLDVNPVTGEEVDRAEIPTWLVAGALYDKRARELVQATSRRITGSGWQAEYQAKALEDVQVRKHRLAQTQLAAMHQDLQREQTATVEQLVRGREYGRAIDAVNSSRAWMPGEKAVLVEKVLAQKQKDEEGDKENRLTAQAEAGAQALEAKYPGNPQAATAEAQAVGGALGVKIAQRLKERDNDRREAEGDQFRVTKDGLELAIRRGEVRTVSQLEALEPFKPLPPGVKADLVQIVNGEEERRVRLAQMNGDREWRQELDRFQGLTDREKVAQWPSYQSKIPLAYQGGFAQVAQTAQMRLSNAWDTEDVQKTFDSAAKVIGWGGQGNIRAARLRDTGRRWYDAETRRRNGVPPTQAEASKWLAERLAYGDENGESMFGGTSRYRFEAELEAQRTGEPVKFEAYGPAKQKYAPAAELVRGAAPGAQPPAAPAPAPAAPPPARPVVVPTAPRPGARVPSEQLGLPPGGVMEFQTNGKWKRVQ